MTDSKGINKDMKMNLESYGIHEGKHDTERWGIFAEMMYLHGMGMTAAPLYDKIGSKRQMYPGFPKWKTSLQDCYFDKEFHRLFEGEAYPRRGGVQENNDTKRKTEFKPQPYPKKIGSPGEFWGTFSGVVEALDNRKKQQTADQRKPAKKPITTNPGKKGGPGFYDITMNKFPEYMSEKYDVVIPGEPTTRPKAKWKPAGPGSYFDPNPYPRDDPKMPTYAKIREVRWTRNGHFVPSNVGHKLGGMKGGGFDKFPEHSADHYIDPQRFQMKRDFKLDPKKPKFKPTHGFKTMPHTSTLGLNVDFRTNADNFEHMTPVTFTREFYTSV